MFFLPLSNSSSLIFLSLSLIPPHLFFFSLSDFQQIREDERREEESEESFNSRRFSTEHKAHEGDSSHPHSSSSHSHSSSSSVSIIPETDQTRIRVRGEEREEDRREEREVTKLKEDLKRLRIHLIQVEDGYTKELLESQEREEELVSKLASAEERIKWQEERLRESSDALKAAGRLVTSIDDKEVAIKKFKDESK